MNYNIGDKVYLDTEKLFNNYHSPDSEKKPHHTILLLGKEGLNKYRNKLFTITNFYSRNYILDRWKCRGVYLDDITSYYFPENCLTPYYIVEDPILKILNEL